MQDTTDSTALYKASILNIHSVTALIAHALNLTGPAVTLDTACSTSAVAIHGPASHYVTGIAMRHWRAAFLSRCLRTGAMNIMKA